MALLENTKKQLWSLSDIATQNLEKIYKNGTLFKQK